MSADQSNGPQAESQGSSPGTAGEGKTNTDSSSSASASSGTNGSDDASTASSSSSSSLSSSSSSLFHKKRGRKRASSLRTHMSTTLEEEKDEKLNQPENNLQMIKQLQDMRHKKAAALQLGESNLHLPDTETANAATSSNSSAAPITASLSSDTALPIAKEFGTEGKDVQTQLIEEQMEKYVAEQLAARRALRQPQKGAAAAASSSAASHSASTITAPDLTEDSLFETPAHLILPKSSFLTHAQVDDDVDLGDEQGERWLAGIAEQRLSVEEKMQHIERTERAKREMMKQEAERLEKKRKEALTGGSMVLPANFNANFQLHKREWDRARRTESRLFFDAQNRAKAREQGLPEPPPSFRPPPNPQMQPNALPGFLAQGSNERRPAAAMFRQGRGGGRGGGGGGRMNLPSDDMIVDRFLKRQKMRR